MACWAVTIAAAWQFTGYVMALYLAGLRGIPAKLREAAAIDGAGTWRTYRYIIIPLLMPVTFTAIVLTGMNSIRVFDIVSAMSGSGAAFATDTLAFFMFQTTFGAYRYLAGRGHWRVYDHPVGVPGGALSDEHAAGGGDDELRHAIVVTWRNLSSC